MVISKPIFLNPEISALILPFAPLLTVGRDLAKSIASSTVAVPAFSFSTNSISVSAIF